MSHIRPVEERGNPHCGKSKDVQRPRYHESPEELESLFGSSFLSESNSNYKSNPKKNSEYNKNKALDSSKVVVLVGLSIVNKSQSCNHHVDHDHKAEDDEVDVFVFQVFVGNGPSEGHHQQHPDQEYLRNHFVNKSKHIEYKDALTIVEVHPVMNCLEKQMTYLNKD